MPRELRVFAIDRIPPGIPLKKPHIVAAKSVAQAALVLKVSTWYLERHPMPAIAQADRQRALAAPGQRLVAQGDA